MATKKPPTKAITSAETSAETLPPQEITMNTLTAEDNYEDEGDMYSLLNQLEAGINKIITDGDHDKRYFEAKRYINNMRKSSELKRTKKYLSLIASRVPGRLRRIVTDIRSMVLLAEDAN